MQTDDRPAKRNKHPTESENEECKSNMDEVVEDLRYIKRLELQRSILSKLVGKIQNKSPINKPDKQKNK